MKKLAIILVLTFSLSSCFWSSEAPVEETATGDTVQETSTGVVAEVKAEDLVIEPTETTTTIKPKTTTSSGEVESTDTDLNAASEEKIVKEFEQEIEDLLKLIEDDAK